MPLWPFYRRIVALFVALFQQWRNRRPLSRLAMKVADNVRNRESTFWVRYIGTTAHRLQVDADGLYYVILEDGNPVDGVAPDRFEEIER